MANEYYVWDEGVGTELDAPSDHGIATAEHDISHKDAARIYLKTREELEEGEMEIYVVCKETSVCKKLHVEVAMEPAFYFSGTRDMYDTYKGVD